MKPYLLQLKEKFTEYELIYTLNFKSKYSIRLYEFLKSIHYNKKEAYTQIIPINKFQSMLDSPYTTFKDFHTRVLKPAQKEINSYSDIVFSYELETSGRKTTQIKIEVKPKHIIAAAVTIPKRNEALLDKKGE
jgi:plasmid replication initiation protein